MKHSFIRRVLLWVIPGIAAGVLTACLLTGVAYRDMAHLAGNVLQGKSVAEALKDSDAKAARRGEAYLEHYGYRTFGRIGKYLPMCVGVNVLLFELAGAVVYERERRDKKRRGRRLEELSAYLAAANRGEALSLMRKEDEFSHLEDEIYKTVMELACTKEAAVKDHEILSKRIADIAHQLKTPLTSMSLMTELLEEYETEETKVYLERLKRQARRLETLVNNLLALAKIDAHTIVFHRKETEVAELLQVSLDALYALKQEKEIQVRILGETQVNVSVDEKWTSEALINVLKNCMEHTPEGGDITITCQQNPLYTEIDIEDGGTGLAKEDIPHVFERFYRGKQAAKDSAGIGLALAKVIVEAQNGHIHAQNSAAGHARFTVRLYPEN